MSRKLSRLTAVLFSIALVLSFGVNVMAQDDFSDCVQVSHRPVPVWVRNFNPFAPDPIQETLDMIYEPLILWNPVLGGEPTPWLATDWEYSDDLLSLTMNLRDDVQWNDGEPFTAEDVVFTFDLLQSNTELDRSGLLAFVDSVEATGDHSLVWNLSQVFTQADTFIGMLNPVPAHIWSDIEDPVTFTNDNPVATGPFSIIESFSDQVYVLGANPNYWQEGKPQVPCLRYPAFASNDPANLAIINGETDWAGHFLPDIDNTYVALDPENNHYFFWPGGGTVSLYLNTTKAPFDDVNLRRAMSQAIDYESVVGIGMYGYTIPADPAGLGPRYENWASQEALDTAAEMGLSAYNPEGAMAVLDEAGYVDTDGDGWRETPAGEPLQFTIQVVNGWSDWVTSVQIITQNFQDVGLNAASTTPEFGEWLNNLQMGTYDVSIGWSTAGRTPYDYFRNQLYSPLIGSDGLANAETWARWTSEDVDGLLDAFTATVDAEEQGDIIDQIQQIYVENVITIPLFPGPTWYEWNTTRFTGFPTEDNYYAQGSPWRGSVNSGRLLIALNIQPVGAE